MTSPRKGRERCSRRRGKALDLDHSRRDHRRYPDGSGGQHRSLDGPSLLGGADRRRSWTHSGLWRGPCLVLGAPRPLPSLAVAPTSSGFTTASAAKAHPPQTSLDRARQPQQARWPQPRRPPRGACPDGGTRRRDLRHRRPSDSRSGRQDRADGTARVHRAQNEQGEVDHRDRETEHLRRPERPDDLRVAPRERRLDPRQRPQADRREEDPAIVVAEAPDPQQVARSGPSPASESTAS